MEHRARRAQPNQGRDLALAYLGATNAGDVVLDRIIDGHILRVLDATDGNLSLAADLLGMHRRSLQRYLRRKRPVARKRRRRA
jgi:ActR/RegA family two-component response regulator